MVGVVMFASLSVFKSSKPLNRISIIVLTAFWSIFSVSFMMTSPTNTVWIFSLAMALIAFGIALKGE